MANFGNIPYGHQIIGKVYYSPNASDNQKKGCEKLSMHISPHPKVDQSPIVLLDRGDCTFVTKVRNAQNAGAHMVIVLNNDPKENIKNIIMADDGTGKGINIPSLIINYKDAEIIKNYIKDNTINGNQPQIILEVDFQTETDKKNKVEYSLWYSPDQSQIYLLLNDLYNYHMEMEEYTKLDIHFGFYSTSMVEEDYKSDKENCYGSGKYCVVPGKFGVRDGRSVLNEMLNQKCIYFYAYDNDKSNAFWDYMQEFYKECILQEDISQRCSEEVMDEVSIPLNGIKNCVDRSFENHRSNEFSRSTEKNNILEEELTLRQRNYITMIPSLYINGRLFNGNLNADSIFESLCASLTVKPDICLPEAVVPEKHKMSSIAIILAIIVIILVNVLIFIICSRIIKRKILQRINNSNIESRIDTVVNSYLKIREGNYS
ncbi:MAG: hypothetical protein MJ252_23185 [archaeon]|nr:hypothetical protein [archaeon]